MSKALGSFKFVDLPETSCYQNFQQFIQALEDGTLAIELPNDISNVTVGPEQPLATQRDNLWIRKDNSGTFIGLYVYSSGQWIQIYPVPSPLKEFQWVDGSSLDIPVGWARADTYPGLTAPEIAYLQAMWFPDAGNPGEYTIFQVYLTG